MTYSSQIHSTSCLSIHDPSVHVSFSNSRPQHNRYFSRQARQNVPVVLQGKCCIVPPLRSPSGCEWPSNQALPFTAAGLQRAAGLTSEGPASPLPVLWDPSTSFRGQMRCKSIKREFVCRSQSLWGSEPLPCHSGAANFLLLLTQT